MKALSIARKTLLELLREPALLGLIVGFPVMLIVLYYVAFGETDQGIAKFLTVLVINEDAGASVGEGERWQAGAQLIDLMRTAELEGNPLFNVVEVTERHTAEATLWERKAAMLVTIPADFTQKLLAASTGTAASAPTTITLLGDPHSGNFVFARSLLDGLVQEFTHAITGWEEPLDVIYEFVPGTGTMSDFDFGVAGVIVFGVVLLVVITAMIMVRENVSGTLRRLRLTRAHARDLLLGVLLNQFVLALVIIPATFGTAVLLGFKSNGSLLLAIGIGLLFSLSVVGLGLIVACFAHNDGEAANMGAIVGVMMVLVSGAMYPMPAAPLFTVGGRTIQLYDLLPPAHAGEALRQVLIYGKGIEAILYELAALTVLSVIFLAVGVVLYQRLQMRRS